MSNATVTSNVTLKVFTAVYAVTNTSSEDVNSSVQYDDPDIISTSPNGMMLALRLTPYIRVVFTLVCIVVNSLVFMATTDVSRKKLTAKRLVQNAIVSDAAVGVGNSLGPLCLALGAFGVPRDIYFTMERLSIIIAAVAIYAHLLTTIVLAVDRMYAVFCPLNYYTTGYNTLSTVLLVTGCWLSAAVLELTATFVPFVKESLPNRPLHMKLRYVFGYYSGPMRRDVLVAMHLLTFLMYIFLFVVLQLKGTCNRVVTDSQSKTRKASVSLATTYFLIHFSSLCLYVPGPLYATLSFSNTTKETRTLITNCLLGLYHVSLVLNSIILVTRVRVIRENLYRILKVRRPVVGKSSYTNSTVCQT